MGIEALEIIDRAVELGVLRAARRACTFCDFLPVCGPNQGASPAANHASRS